MNNKKLNEEIGEEQMRKIRQSVVQRKSLVRNREHSEVVSLLGKNNQDPFDLNDILFFKIDNLKRKAYLISENDMEISKSIKV